MDGAGSPVDTDTILIEAGNQSPTAPTVNAPTSGEVNTPISISVVTGTDPDGTQTKVQCTSDDSNYPSGSAYDSGFGSEGRTVTPQFQWSTTGTQTITCVTFDVDGAASPADTDTISIQNTTGNQPPTAPEIDSPSIGEVNVQIDIDVITGTDPDGTQTKVQCTSAGSNYTDSSPYDSGLGSEGRTVTPTFQWPNIGVKTIYCVTFDQLGAASNVESSEISIQEDSSSCDECIPGASYCVDDFTLALCDYNNIGCAVWSFESCSLSEECIGYECSECEIVGKECGFDNCGNLIATCPEGEVCDEWECIDAGGFENEANATEVDAVITELIMNYPINWTDKEGYVQTSYIPSRVIKAIMWVESGWHHFQSPGQIKYNDNGDGTWDYGIMQVNGPANDPYYVNMNWYDNLDIGISRLVSKWNSVAYEYEDPSIIENWYYPIAAYNGLSFNGVNDPSKVSSGNIPDYYLDNPDLIANQYTYQDKVLGVLESPSSWGVRSDVISEGKFSDIGLQVTRPYSIPGWITEGISWNDLGYTVLQDFTSETESYEKPEDVPALQSFGYSIHRWIESASGGFITTINPVSPPPGAEPTVTGWVLSYTINSSEQVNFSGTIYASSYPISKVTFVIGTPTGEEDRISQEYPDPVDTVDLSSFSFDPSEYQGQVGRYIVGLWVKVTNIETPYLLKSSEIIVRHEGFYLSTPLAGFTPYNAPINSVFDHSMATPYGTNGEVTAYTGEYGDRNGSLKGYQNDDGTDFIVNGNYTGAGDPSRLYYDGHPGIDYRTWSSKDLLATFEGVVTYPTYNDSDYMHILQIDHGNGYVTQYWHCKERISEEGDYVYAGDKVAIAGKAGTKDVHLHLEILFEDVPIDPYGWLGSYPDPYTVSSNINLWLPEQKNSIMDNAINYVGIAPCLVDCRGNTFCEGDQCILRCSTGDECPDNQACFDGLCLPYCSDNPEGVCIDDGQEEDDDDDTDDDDDNIDDDVGDDDADNDGGSSRAGEGDDSGGCGC